MWVTNEWFRLLFVRSAWPSGNFSSKFLRKVSIETAAALIELDYEQDECVDWKNHNFYP